MRKHGKSPVGRALRVGATCLLIAVSTGAVPAVPPVGYIENVQDPEDLVQLPGTKWIVASGRKPVGTDQPGHLYLINSENGESEIVYPRSGAEKPTNELGAGCGGAPDVRNFEAHGLGLRPGLDGRSHLYVANHASPKGGREAIELFTIDARGVKPIVTWSDCVPTPPHSWFNDVVALPGGGFAATDFMDPGDRQADAKLQAGQVTGNVLEWHRGVGFEAVPNSEMSGANGIETDPEGRYYFVNAWGSRELVRIARADHRRTSVRVGMLADNNAWTWDGRLIVVGQAMGARDIGGCLANPKCPIPFRALEIDPVTLTSKVLIDEKDTLWAATSPRPVNGELWIGGQRTSRIARYRFR